MATLFILAGGAYALWGYGVERTDDAQVEADIVPLSAQVGGTVTEAPVGDNQLVQAGDLLLQIDQADYVVRVKQAEAELEAARAQAAAADAQVEIVQASSSGGLKAAQAQYSGSTAALRSSDAQVAAAQAALEAASSQLTEAEIEFRRTRNLNEEGVVTQQALDAAQARYDSAQAAHSQAQAGLDAALEQRQLAQTKIDEAEGRLDQSRPVDEQQSAALAASKLAHARVAGAEAALEMARLQLKRTSIVAPAEGKISELAVRAGQTVQPGQLVVELVPTLTYVVANFKETQMKRIRPGQRVKIKIDAYSGQTFEGRVSSIAAATGARFSLLPPDNASGNFVKVVQRVPVKIDWIKPFPDVPLQAGLAVGVTVFVK